MQILGCLFFPYSALKILALATARTAFFALIKKKISDPRNLIYYYIIPNNVY